MFLFLNSKLLIVQLITPPLDAKEVAEMELLSTSEKKDYPLLLNTLTRESRTTAKNLLEITNLPILTLNSMDVRIFLKIYTTLP